MSKFNNIKVAIDGYKFDSKGEGARYLTLKRSIESGEISNLRLQTPYDLSVNGMKVCRYIADFNYTSGPCEVVEDYKGIRTSIYSLKAKLMRACHDIRINEVFKPDDPVYPWYSRCKLLKPVDGFKKGKMGTIVHVFPTAFIVEIDGADASLPFGGIITVKPTDLTIT
jgi:hypothetical protein